MDFQTRSEESGLNNFPSLALALEAAALDYSIWKISFSLPNGERVRLIGREKEWKLESILDWRVK